MTTLFVLSIIYKMALYMIYANFIFYILSANLYGHILFTAFEPTDALFVGGHPLFASAVHNFMPILVVLIIASLSCQLNNIRPSLRFAPYALLFFSFYQLLLFPLSLYPAHNIATAIFLFLPLVYLTVKISIKDFSVDADGLRARLKSLLILAFIPLFALVLGGFAMLSSAFYFQYVIIFIGSIIGILRLARGNEAMLSEPKFIAISLAPVFVISFLILISQQIAEVIWRALQFVAVNIIVPAVFFIGTAIEWFFSLFNTVDPVTPDESIGGNHGVYEDIWGTFRVVATEGEGVHIYVLAGIFTIFLVVVVFRVLKVTSRRRQSNANNGLTEERSRAGSLSKKKFSETHTEYKHSLFAPRNPRLAVRYYYRQFLKICTEKGCPPEKGDTSKDIYLKNRELFSEEAMAELRGLYIKARYSEEEVKKSESKRSGELLKHL